MLTPTQKAWAVALLLSAPALARGQAFRHEKTIYADGKDVAFGQPEGIACDDKGNFVVADTGNGRLLTFTTLAGSVSPGAEVKLPQLSYPVRVQITRAGDVMALDRKSKRIVRLDTKGAFAGYAELKGLASPTSVVPVSFKLDASDDVFVLDIASRNVIETDPGGNVIRQVPLPKDGTFIDVAVDAGGLLYALDPVAAQVWVADKSAAAFKPLTSGMKDRMSFPTYLTVARGKLYLVDQNGGGIAVLGTDGSYQGRQLALGWTDGLVLYPAQLCINGPGDVFLADRGNSRIQLFTMAR